MLTCRDPGISHLIIIGTIIALFEEKKKRVERNAILLL